MSGSEDGSIFISKCKEFRDGNEITVHNFFKLTPRLRLQNSSPKISKEPTSRLPISIASTRWRSSRKPTRKTRKTWSKSWSSAFPTWRATSTTRKNESSTSTTPKSSFLRSRIGKRLPSRKRFSEVLLPLKPIVPRFDHGGVGATQEETGEWTNNPERQA